MFACKRNKKNKQDKCSLIAAATSVVDLVDCCEGIIDARAPDIKGRMQKIASTVDQLIIALKSE